MVIEDVMCGAGAIEMQVGADDLRPLWMWGVDGLSIQMFAGWDGSAREARYYQTQGYGGVGNLSQDGILLRNDELIYIKPNPTTANPFGTGPLEVAFLSVSRQLGVADFAGNLTSNSKPSTALQIKGADTDAILAFRSYWRNEIEAQGNMPILGGEDAQVMRLWPDGDKALYLEYQQWLVREIATAFDLSPQNFGVEADVNRNTAEVAEDRDWDAAIKPMARKFSAHLTREALHAKLGFYQLEHKFIGMDRSDEKATAEIYALYYDRNAITPNEQRDKLGLEPSKSQWADLTNADVKIATEAARSMATDLDDDLPNSNPSPAPAAKRAAKPRTPKEPA
jgi:phage portal protein BeeE